VSVELDARQLPDLVRAGGAPHRCLFARPDLVLLGTGSSVQVPLEAPWAGAGRTSRVGEVLGAIAYSDDGGPPGAGPVAIGALPYDPELAGHLRVPRFLLAHHKATGQAWATAVVPKDAFLRATALRAIEEHITQLRDEPRPLELPDSFRLSAHMPHPQWKALIRRTVAEMEAGSFDKVVLARRVDVEANGAFVLHEALARLEHLYPSCTVFHCAGFAGASPETLVSRSGREVVSHPLAGTIARSGDSTTDDALLAGLMASAKDRREHQLVVDAIAALLEPLCSQLEVPAVPSVLALRNVSHLGTRLRGTLRDASGPLGRPPTSLELAAVLQPTPAVGGHPTGPALRWQRDNEGFDRGYYAGPVGWVDHRGDGAWALGLRSADIGGHRAALYAGSGIVVGSDPDGELAETQLKLQALLAAIVRP
jgi:menaquinone-specific isochorismate synthase